MGDYFVRIQESKELRRNLLESSKLLIQNMKQEHELMELRERKLAVQLILRKELKELSMQLNHLEKALPVTTKKQLAALMPPEPKRPRVREERRERPQDLSKLERLQESLELIEKRLDKI